MTKPEITNKRDLTFSKWVREFLPDSQTGYSASDIDFILWNWKTKKIMLVEVKTRSKEIAKGQKTMFQNLHKWIKKGVAHDWQYLGFHLITFQNTFFDDGKVFLDGREITERDLIEFLSMK
jgi:hypothetical protein